MQTYLPGCEKLVTLRSMTRQQVKQFKKILDDRTRNERDIADVGRQLEESMARLSNADASGLQQLVDKNKELTARLDELTEVGRQQSNEQQTLTEEVMTALYGAEFIDSLDNRDWQILSMHTAEWSRGVPEGQLKNYGTSGSTTATQTA